eukprot:gnl/MRDRNA2_/MRDRNA2_89670_c0_seq1.p1 gnl/MRDRNA2_/MRDRNA2_89670_c0~~gnl/MRDRNA2_/MRDRNA2_89670_c0_seq1.p1  ORF type:complete len:674 (+),score=156.91 gnl/MRDRNA2_/MRDRNA2_89670_c0_seq1:198-2024(+)
MTVEEWNEFQTEKWAAEWPKPEYMNEKREMVHVRDGGEGAYRDKTYEIVTRWRADTQISYRPHAKKPGSKSHVRYEKYAVATTVGESLALGSYPIDWCYDYEHGFIKVLGPCADEPIDPSKVEANVDVSDVEKVIGRWFRRELAKKYNLDLKELVTAAGETTMLRAHRLVADRKAAEFLKDAKENNRIIAEEEVEKVLMTWGFAKNGGRVNVMPENQNWVWSDTLGLLRDRVGDIHLTPPTARYPNFVRIITKYLEDRIPEEVNTFKFTSLNLNCNYAAKRHRDGNNFGPSIITGFGNYTGGELAVFPEDDRGRSDLFKLPEKDRMSVSIKQNIVMFNGNSAHEVDSFQGMRFSVVYFTAGCHAKACEEDKDQLLRLGFPYPAPDEDCHALLPAPKGYDAKPVAPKKGNESKETPKVRVWNVQEATQSKKPGQWAAAVMEEMKRAHEKKSESAENPITNSENADLTPTQRANLLLEKRGRTLKRKRNEAKDEPKEEKQDEAKQQKNKSNMPDTSSTAEEPKQGDESPIKKENETKGNVDPPSSSTKAPRPNKRKPEVKEAPTESLKENKPFLKQPKLDLKSPDAPSKSVVTTSKDANRPMKQLTLSFK